MPSVTATLPDPRVVGLLGGGRPGPTTVLVGALHGNEPAGVMATQRVLGEIARRGGDAVRGRVVGVVGNAGAMSRRARYLEEDLNRVWTRERTDAMRRGLVPSSPEAGEQASLIALLDSLADGGEPLTVVDLHSASATAPPFTIAAGSDLAVGMAAAVPVPTVGGLERHLEGLLLSWLAGEGHGAVVFEAGEHTAVETVGYHAAAIRTILDTAGHVELAPGQRADDRRVLADAARGLPEGVEIVHRHPTAAEDDFMMLPGFSTFDRVRKGRLLATDRRGDVRAPTDGWLLLPRYQRWGSDGFFIGR